VIRCVLVVRATGCVVGVTWCVVLVVDSVVGVILCVVLIARCMVWANGVVGVT
jgi:hypothetical protein